MSVQVVRMAVFAYRKIFVNCQMGFFFPSKTSSNLQAELVAIEE